MSLKDRIADDLKAAMAERQAQRVAALRLIRAEILKAEKEKGIPADDARVMAVLQGMLKQRRESIAQFEAAGRADLAAAERAEMDVIAAYLPPPLADAEIDAVIDEVLAAAPADARHAGKLTGQVMARLKAMGRPFEPQDAARRVRDRLAPGS